MTRAEPGASRTAARLEALGFSAVVVPLLAVRPLPRAAPVLEGVAALAFTSINGVEAFTALSRSRDLPVFTVGDATAEAARDAGFEDVRSADGALGDLAELIATAAPGGAVLAPGALQPSGDLPALLAGRVEVTALPVYEAVETGAVAPADWDAVLIHSRRAAVALAGRGPGAVAADRLAVAISAAAAEPLEGAPFAGIRIAGAPTEAAVLEALGNPPPDV